MQVVGIIGSGAAGICAIKNVLETPGLTPISWEHSSDIGGTWVYTPRTGADQHGYPIHSSMYESLRTNLPREIMAFPGFPFKTGGRSFVKHPEVRKYLNNYADYFDARKYIKFQHHVELVEPVTEGEAGTAWKVYVKNLADGSMNSVICDFIIVANGHYTVPKNPSIKNIELFKGLITHSHSYRESSAYKGLKVAILGASSSGLDVAIEVSKVAAQVYLCHNFPEPVPSKLPENVFQMKGIDEALENEFVLLDGSVIQTDALINCTGYEYSFPFLGTSSGITVRNNQVKPLYKHLIHTEYPTMCLIGIPSLVLPFPFFDVQIRYFLQVCLGSVSLPEKDTMANLIEEILRRVKSEGLPPHYMHFMADRQWAYMANLIQEANLTPLPDVVQKIDADIRYHRRRNLTTYKETNYFIVDGDSFTSPFVEINGNV